MDILLLDALVPEVMAWLQERHSVELAPALADDPRALRQALYKTQALLLPRRLTINRELLDFAPLLKVLARLQSGTDNTDLEACHERRIAVVNTASVTVRSNSEYLLGCLVMLYRRGLVTALMGRSQEAPHLGREMYGSVVGLLGLAPVAHALAPMLKAMGMRVIGYDPAIHHSSHIWQTLGIEPVSLRELMAQADAVSVQVLYASRYKGFVNEAMLAHCKRQQIWVGLSRSDLFDAQALATALTDGRIEACMLDGAEGDFAGPGSPLHLLRNLFLTPRISAQTKEARAKASWYVAHRLDKALNGPIIVGDPVLSQPMGLLPPADENPSQWGAV